MQATSSETGGEQGGSGCIVKVRCEDGQVIDLDGKLQVAVVSHVVVEDHQVFNATSYRLNDKLKLVTSECRFELEFVVGKSEGVTRVKSVSAHVCRLLYPFSGVYATTLPAASVSRMVAGV